MRLWNEKSCRESFAAFASQFPQNINKKKSARAQFWLTVVSSREYTRFDIQPRVDQLNPRILEQARREKGRNTVMKSLFPSVTKFANLFPKLFLVFSFSYKTRILFCSQRVDDNDNSVWNSIKDTFLIFLAFWSFWLNFLKDKKFRLCSSRSRSGEATIRSPEDVFRRYLLVDWKHSLRCELIPYLIINARFVWIKNIWQERDLRVTFLHLLTFSTCRKTRIRFLPANFAMLSSDHRSESSKSSASR